MGQEFLLYARNNRKNKANKATIGQGQDQGPGSGDRARGQGNYWPGPVQLLARCMTS